MASIADNKQSAILNVGGVKHKVLWDTLNNCPDSLLGNLASSGSDETYIRKGVEQDEFCFERNPVIFGSIIDFYRTGKLHYENKYCPLSFQEELSYWMISEDHLSSCCKKKYLYKKWKANQETDQLPSSQSPLLFNLGNPVLSWVVYLLSLSIVMLCLLAMTLNTIPALKGSDRNGNPLDNPICVQIQLFCVVFCTVEFILQLRFLKDLSYVVDFLAVLPFYVTFAITGIAVGDSEDLEDFEASGDEEYSYHLDTHSQIWQKHTYNRQPISFNENEEVDDVNYVLELFKILKVLWVLKLVRYSTALQNIAYILRKNIAGVGIIFQVLAFTAVFFGCLVYTIEKDEQSGFHSLPSSFYWAVITMTTVGYGDIFPVTKAGKIVGTCCAVSGVIFMVVCIAIMVAGMDEVDKRKEMEKIKEEIRPENKEDLRVLDPEEHLSETTF